MSISTKKNLKNRWSSRQTEVLPANLANLNQTKKIALQASRPPALIPTQTLTQVTVVVMRPSRNSPSRPNKCHLNKRRKMRSARL